MQADETKFESREEAAAARERQRALRRLAELVRLSQQVAAMPARDRPVPLSLMRRVVFAAYREALAAGAGEEATRILREGGAAAPHEA
jgi:hypothetical protein